MIDFESRMRNIWALTVNTFIGHCCLTKLWSGNTYLREVWSFVALPIKSSHTGVLPWKQKKNLYNLNTYITTANTNLYPKDKNSFNFYISIGLIKLIAHWFNIVIVSEDSYTHLYIYIQSLKAAIVTNMSTMQHCLTKFNWSTVIVL